MKLVNGIRLLLLLIMLCHLLGCTSVASWQRAILAKPQMALDVYPVQSTFQSHIYNSREAVTGNSSAGGGGCGCN